MNHPSVLLVDDHEEAVLLLADLLELEGFIVRAATSAAQALKMMEEACPDAVVSDLEMPEMDGYELARRIQALYPGRVHLVALSGRLPSGESPLGPNDPFQYKLGKPVALNRLVAILDSGRLMQ